MTDTPLSKRYRAYIACLNRQDWASLQEFVRDDVSHNGRPFGLAGYRAMLERDFAEIRTFSSTSKCWSPNRLSSPAG